MGYRTYIGFISKEEYNKIKCFNQKQLCAYKGEEDKECYVGAYEVVKELYEFGKYTEFDNEKFFTPFWDNKEFQKYYEGDFWIVNKEFLKHIIEHYADKVKLYYNKMLSPFFSGKYDREPSEFLNTIKTKYGGDEHEHKFDFSKITDNEQTQLFNIIEHVKGMRSEWVNEFAYDLGENDKITGSWKYEYSIFELVRIYKTFDWENNELVYYGY